MSESDNFEDWMEKNCGCETDEQKLKFLNDAIRIELNYAKHKGYSIGVSQFEKYKEKVLSRIADKVLLGSGDDKESV